jgi:hypothetical protein
LGEDGELSDLLDVPVARVADPAPALERPLSVVV